MNDLELRNLLLTTSQVGPGQESRAWLSLKQRLGAPAFAPVQNTFSFLRPLAYGAAGLACAAAIFSLGLSMRPSTHSFAFVDSQVPGIYATSFYSHSAHAQVVWLKGLEPATDQPTYLDPTSAIKTSSRTDSPSAKSSGSL